MLSFVGSAKGLPWTFGPRAAAWQASRALPGSSRYPDDSSLHRTFSTSTSDPAAQKHKKKHKINLTPEESKLLRMFSKFVKEERLGTTVRVAGGWVRDKLLGLEGKPDIDIALDNITGNAFATALGSWNDRTQGASSLSAGINFTSAEQKKIDPRTGQPYIKVSVIKSNPARSKHLETATTRLGKFSIDFVQLRSEEYNGSSRIPQVKFGTPLEDALRRDLTINSLFYNVNTGAVEDFTGLGLRDLENHRISTPLPALTTLQDDPLRAFRAVRFASRFGFDVDPDLASAAREYSVHEALDTKVSRERIYLEFRQMLYHPVPEIATRAVVMLAQLQLLPIALVLPDPAALPPPPWTMKRKTAPDGSFDKNDAREMQRFTETFHMRGVNILMLMTGLETALPTANPHSQYTRDVLEMRLLADSIAATATATAAVDGNGNGNGKHKGKIDPDASEKKKEANERKLVCSRAAALTFAASDWYLDVPRLMPPNRQAEVCEKVLAGNLRMSNEYFRIIESTISAARKFRLVLDELMAYNAAHGLDVEAQLEDPAAAAAAANSSSTSVEYKSMQRETVGLIMREAGSMYMPALELAVASKLHDALVGVHTEGHANTEVMHIQGIMDMLSATMFGTTNSCEASYHPRNALGFYENLLSGPQVETTLGDEVIAAGRDVMHGIRALQLMEDYNVPPLLNGNQIKAMFPNMNKNPATFFGELIKEVLRWQAATPKALRTEAALVAGLKNKFKDQLL